ncbi:MAG: 50S ribosomal protein L10 [Candidatus Cloacimonetes bacterium]|nr:50S ribosomal protein L10 [Candidatus Cloacimonadota bacterium]
MANIKQYKIDNVKTIRERLDGARVIVLVDYKGIKVDEVNKLRNVLRTNKVDYFVAKNTWIRIALNMLDIKHLDPYLINTTAVAVSKVDEVAPARVIKKFVETELENKELLKFKVGLIGEDIYDTAQLRMLADLPSKEELVAKVLYGFNAPITGFVGVLGGVIRKFVYAIDAIAKQKAE